MQLQSQSAIVVSKEVRLEVVEQYCNILLTDDGICRHPVTRLYSRLLDKSLRN